MESLPVRGRSKLEIYKVTPLTFGSSNDSTTRVSLNTSPEPDICPIVRLPSAACVSLAGKATPSVTAAAPVRNDESADRRENISSCSSLLLAAMKLLVEPFERARVGDRVVTSPSEVNALAPLPTMKAKRYRVNIMVKRVDGVSVGGADPT